MYIGSSVLIICYSNDPVIWTINGMAITHKRNGTMNSIIEIRKVTEKDSGKYTCNGTINSSGDQFVATSQLLVARKLLICTI